MKKSLLSAFMAGYTTEKPSCPTCKDSNIDIYESSEISKINPLGEKMVTILCKDCGHSTVDTPDIIAKTELKKWLISGSASYIIQFEFKGSAHYVRVEDFTAYHHGFWVDEDMCAMSLVRQEGEKNCAAYWIPPGKIDHIEIDLEERRMG